MRRYQMAQESPDNINIMLHTMNRQEKRIVFKHEFKFYLNFSLMLMNLQVTILVCQYSATTGI